MDAYDLCAADETSPRSAVVENRRQSDQAVARAIPGAMVEDR